MFCRRGQVRIGEKSLRTCRNDRTFLVAKKTFCRCGEDKTFCRRGRVNVLSLRTTPNVLSSRPFGICENVLSSWVLRVKPGTTESFDTIQTSCRRGHVETLKTHDDRTFVLCQNVLSYRVSHAIPTTTERLHEFQMVATTERLESSATTERLPGRDDRTFGCNRNDRTFFPTQFVLTFRHVRKDFSPTV